MLRYPDVRFPKKILSPLGAPLLGLVAFAGCVANSVIDQSYDYARLGDYRHAFEVLDHEYQRQLAAGEVDERLARARDRMEREFLRDRAQQHIFQEREDQALRDLDRLEALEPGHPALAPLREAALLKKAKRIVAYADELLQEKDLTGAMSAYLESQRFVPGFELAEEGMAKVRAEVERMNARAQQQFLQAVRKVPEFRHIEVAWHAAAVIKNTTDPEDARLQSALAMEANAQSESARRTFERGRECENENRFGAALVLYKAARDLDPKVEGVDEAIARMNKELKALGMLEKAQIEMRNGRFKEAQEMLSNAFAISSLSRADISDLMIQARQMQGQKEYREARDLEVMGKKAEALAAFEALAEKWPDGLEDEQQRIVSLRVDIEGARTEWEAAEKAEAEGRLEEALDHYINAERYYAEWRDGEAEIARLRRLIAEQKAAEGAGGGEGRDS